MTTDEIKACFSKHDPRLTSLILKLAVALIDVGLKPEQSKYRSGNPGDTLRFYLPKTKQVLVSIQYYAQRGFLVFNWFLNQTNSLDITDSARELLGSTFGFAPPDESPKAFTKTAMVVRIHPSDDSVVDRAIPKIKTLLENKMERK